MPRWTDVSTGGGSEALQIDRGGFYAWATDDEGCSLPEPGRPAIVGFYSAETDEPVGEMLEVAAWEPEAGLVLAWRRLAELGAGVGL